MAPVYGCREGGRGGLCVGVARRCGLCGRGMEVWLVCVDTGGGGEKGLSCVGVVREVCPVYIQGVVFMKP